MWLVHNEVIIRYYFIINCVLKLSKIIFSAVFKTPGALPMKPKKKKQKVM